MYSQIAFIYRVHHIYTRGKGVEHIGSHIRHAAKLCAVSSVGNDSQAISAQVGGRFGRTRLGGLVSTPAVGVIHTAAEPRYFQVGFVIHNVRIDITTRGRLYDIGDVAAEHRCMEPSRADVATDAHLPRVFGVALEGLHRI